MTPVAPYQAVINEAFADAELRSIAAQEMTYCMHCAGGRPSDNARIAVRYIIRAVSDNDPTKLASPTAQRRLADWMAAR
jgi:hypothetical protein